MTPDLRYFIGSDGDHNYLVPLVCYEDWQEFLRGAVDPESNFNAGLTPDYAVRIDGGFLVFSQPEILSSLEQLDA